MNPQVPNELISAYFDGEASPEERAVVESLLDESTATRRELDEIAQLSALLHSFPRESAPAELVANVQRQTDQMPLVALAPLPVAARSLRREWTAAALGAIVTAAALMLMVNFADRSGSRVLARKNYSESAIAQTDGDGTRDRRLMAPALADNSAATGNRPLAEKSSGVGIGGEGAMGPVTAPLPTQSAAPKATVSMSKSGAAPAPDDDAAPRRAVEPFVETQQYRNIASNSTLLDNTITLTNGDFVNGLKMGQVQQFVLQAADPESNVAVVDLEVLDIERGADQVQVLLSRHSIRPRLPGQMSDRDKQNFVKLREQSKAGSNEIIAVYTYGPGEKLAKTLEDMAQHPDVFLSWSSQPPVQLPSSEELEKRNSDLAAAKDAATPADQPTPSKQLAAQRKEPTAEDDMDSEAELALNVLLARGGYANSGLANFSDATVKNGPQEQAGGGKPFSSAAAGTDPTSRDPKAQRTESKNAPPAAVRAQSMPSIAKKGADQKQDSVARKELAPRSAYQRTLRVSNDAPISAEPALPLTRSQGQNLDRGMNTNRRYSANVGQQPADVNVNSRVDANQAVKVLFVLHPAQAPVAAPASQQKP